MGFSEVGFDVLGFGKTGFGKVGVNRLFGRLHATNNRFMVCILSIPPSSQSTSTLFTCIILQSLHHQLTNKMVD